MSISRQAKKLPLVLLAAFLSEQFTDTNSFLTVSIKGRPPSHFHGSFDRKQHILHGSRNQGNKKDSKRVGGGGGFGKAATKSKDLFSTPSLYIPDESEEIKEFLALLKTEECEGIEETCIGISCRNGVRGLFAKESYQVGEFILAIPFVSTLTLLITNDESAISDVELGLAFLQKYWKSNGENNKKWKAYLNCLPTRQENFDATPDFWDTSTLGELQIPKLIKESLDRKNEVISIAARYPDIDPNDLQFATWLVRSRVFSTYKKIRFEPSTKSTTEQNEEDSKCLQCRKVLIPYFDFINHSSNHPNAELRVIEGTSDEESMYALQATRPIAAGQEISISYGVGHETTLDLYAKYGFLTIGQNDNDANLDLEKHANWTTSLDHDRELLQTSNLDDNTKAAISLRIYLKSLQEKRKS